MPSYDNVNRPKQYNLDKVSIQDGTKYDKSIEPIDYIERLLTGHDFSGFEGAMVKDIIKYVSRFPFKGQRVEDLEKAQFYLNRLIEHEIALGQKELTPEEAEDVAKQIENASSAKVNSQIDSNVKDALAGTSTTTTIEPKDENGLSPVDVSKVKNHKVE